MAIFRFGAIALVLTAFFLSAPLAHAASGNINFLIGAKTLDDDWEPTEDHSEFGVEIDFRPNGSPINFVIDFKSSTSDKETLFDPFSGITFEVELETTELNFGVRKIWEELPNNIRPFIGGGLSLATMTAEITIPGFGSIDDSGSGVGIWFGGGVYWTLAQHFNIGLEAGFSAISVEVFDEDEPAGGTHFGLLLGYHWGGAS